MAAPINLTQLRERAHAAATIDPDKFDASMNIETGFAVLALIDTAEAAIAAANMPIRWPTDETAAMQEVLRESVTRYTT